MSYRFPREGEQAPTVTIEEGNGLQERTTYTHPAFGQISVNRVNSGGGGVNLYDSDFGHNQLVCVTINESQLNRDLARDWHFARKQIVEFYMSESQWATFVSSFGQGGGIPITISWRDNIGKVPGIPAFDRSEAFAKDMRDTTESSAQSIREVIELIKESGLSQKKQKEIISKANMALRDVTSSVEFVQEQFEEHIENVVERGKQEIHGYMNSAINRAGLAALGADSHPLALK